MRRPCRATLAFAALFALAPACTPGSESGASSAADPSAWSTTEAAPSGTARAPATLAPHTRWELFETLPALRKAAPRARSSHLAGEHDAEVLVNEAAAAYPALGPQRKLGEGALVVEALQAPGAAGVATYFAMLKSPGAGGEGAWEYLVVAPSGEIEQRGALPLCERCHIEAPHDHLFGRSR